MKDKMDWEMIEKKRIISRAAAEMRRDLYRLTRFRAGCFRFDDGTMQGWQLNQLYDSSSAKKLNVLTGFQLANSHNLALSASANPIAVLDTGVQKCDIYLESPDLLANANWQGIEGFSLDVQGNFWSACYIVKSGYHAQLQAVLLDKAGKEHVFAEWNPKANDFLFHDIAPYQPYHIVWKPEAFSDAQYKLKRVKVRLTTPYIHNYECGMRGQWLIGNVCPEK